MFPVVTLKAISGHGGSHGKSESRSFAEETNQEVLQLSQKRSVGLGRNINKICLMDQERREGCSSVDETCDAMNYCCKLLLLQM